MILTNENDKTTIYTSFIFLDTKNNDYLLNPPKKKFVINPDSKIARNIIYRCILNDGYCPCGAYGDQSQKCPCDNMQTLGECHCGLYVEDKESTTNV